MSEFSIKLATRRALLALIASVTLWFFAVKTAVAQMNACVLTDQLIWIETAVFDLRNNDPLVIESGLRTLQAELDSGREVPPLFDQITGNPAWLENYLLTRARFLSLFIAGQYIQSNNLKNSTAFRVDGPILKDLRAALFCAPNGSGSTGPAEDNIEDNKSSQKGLSRMLRALSGPEASVARVIVTNWLVMLPFFLLVAVGILVWGMIRYDEYRRACRRRFFCLVEISIRFKKGDDTVLQKGQIIDISRSGAGLLIAGDLPENVTIQISAANWQASLKVVHINGRQVGAAFIKTLPAIPSDFNLTSERKFVQSSKYMQHNPPAKNPTLGASEPDF